MSLVRFTPHIRQRLVRWPVVLLRFSFHPWSQLPDRGHEVDVKRETCATGEAQKRENSTFSTGYLVPGLEIEQVLMWVMSS